MPSSTTPPSIPTKLLLSQVQRFLPKPWKQPAKHFDKQFAFTDASMVGVLVAALKDFVNQANLSNAFKTFFQIQQHAAPSPSTAASSYILLHPISSLLLGCTNHKSLPQGKQLHAQVISLGLDQHPILVSRLTNFYTSFTLLADANVVVESSTSLDPLPWNMVISSYVRNGLFMEALSAHKKMVNKRIEPDDFTYPSVLKACGELLDYATGAEVHKSIEASSIGWSVFVHNALVSMYGRFGELKVARQLFDKMHHRDDISWNAMINGYASRGMWEEAFHLFGRMQEEGVEMNVIIWNTIAGGCLHSGNFSGALQMLSQMRTKIHLDNVALLVGLNACSHIGALKLGKEIHGHAVRTCLDTFENREQFEKYLLLWNSLVDMYARSGKVLEARRVFDSLSRRDEVTYTSMILGYGMKGEGQTALKLFEEMCKLNIKPDHVTMVAVLTACSHSGLVSQGQLLFKQMIDFHGIVPRIEHFACMVDLYGRAGHLDKAKGVITAMPCKPTTAMWATLIGACRIHGNTMMGE
ncbi:hypothetical protein PIB30_023828 [Stylosanthes scabra]|uniref:Pentatricopeptide repeat-containing protein n=1 Tax=Stylosanthes scabra TaxID=79078 RepID=A0ABU6Z9X7_9FABA|nr:hypothetical protein [Stylosanthes scabra]